MSFFKRAIGARSTSSNAAVRRYARLSMVGAVVTGLAVSAGIYAITGAELDRALSDMVAREKAETATQAKVVDQALTQIYQNIRTISFLPDVREMDRHATNLGPSAKATIQQIYNNLWSNVRVSEIYFIPESFDPSKIDPVTGNPEEPALMYDEMITGDAPSQDAGGEETAADEPEGQEEIEDQEYALITEQLAWYKSNYPTNRAIDGLNVPVISGRAVATCDNTDFNKTLVERDRAGLIFSVPWFNAEGKFAGMVSAIVRTNVLSEFLAESNAALVSPVHTESIFSATPGQAQESVRSVMVAEADKGLRYSEAVRLDLPDPQAKWTYWRGLPESHFSEAGEIGAIKMQRYIGIAVVMLLFSALSATICFVARRFIVPANDIAAALVSVAEGRTDTVLKIEKRDDILGKMADAVQLFQDKALALEAAEAERAAAEAEKEAFRRKTEADAAQRLAEATAGLAHGLRALAGGDLSISLNEPFSPDFEPLRHDFNTSVNTLGRALAAIRASAETVDRGSAEISDAVGDLSQRTEKQAVAIEQTAGAVEEIARSVSNASERIKEARAVTAAANSSAARTGQIVGEAIDAMSRIEGSSGEIGRIITVIDEIAFQTNLLALNAGVEAARAGEAGKGFAVVAQEVRELAQRSASAAKEIENLISRSNGEVSHGVKLVSDAGAALKAIEDSVSEINSLMDAINDTTGAQSAGLAEVTSAVSQMDQVTQQNASMVAQTTAAAKKLAGEAGQLDGMAAAFRLPDGTAPVARRAA